VRQFANANESVKTSSKHGGFHETEVVRRPLACMPFIKWQSRTDALDTMVTSDPRGEEKGFSMAVLQTDKRL
jgi:hypothetical protein